MYIVVRGDLTVGEKLAQSNHVSFMFGAMFSKTTIEWIENSNYIVILETKNELELRLLAKKAIELNLKVAFFEEPDLNDSLTAICIEPGEKTKKICSNLKLAGSVSM